MKYFVRLALACVIVFAATSCLLEADVVFDFENVPVGTATSFSDTVNGLSATFTSSGDPGGFHVLNSGTLFSTLTGNVLGDPGPAGLSHLTLSILFSALQSSVALNFSTFSPISQAGVPFTLDAFNGASMVGSATVTGSVPPDFDFPEGLISFAGSAFDRVVLSTSAADFTIDNVTVSSATAVPEPGGLPAGVLVFVAFSIVAKRKLLVSPRDA